MEPVNLICMRCKHFRPISGGCAAFPDDIPGKIISGKNLHKVPLKGQGNEIVFEPGEPIELIQNESIPKPDYILEYRKVFGKDPVVIGMFWSEPERVIHCIKEAIVTKVEYNELQLLSPKEREAYLQGNILF